MDKQKLVELFDKYRQKVRETLAYDCTAEFLVFARNVENMRLQWAASVEECQRLKKDLDQSNSKISDLEKKLDRVRYHIDAERKRARKAETEREEAQDQLFQIQEILCSVHHAGNQLANETKEKIDKFLNHTTTKVRTSFGEYAANRLNTIDEINSTVTDKVRSSRQIFGSSSSSCNTGSLLSIDCTQSEDADLSSSRSSRRSEWIPSRRSMSPYKDAPANKRRRSSRIQKLQQEENKVTAKSTDRVVATTTVKVPRQGGQITAKSKIETFPKNDYLPSAPLLIVTTSSSDCDSDNIDVFKNVPPPPPHHTSSPTGFFMTNKLFTRSHCFVNKFIIKAFEQCDICLKRANFSNRILRCNECKMQCHMECRDQVKAPCLPVVETPRTNQQQTISDYCSKIPPLIPPIVVCCVMEVEARGLCEVGIYRVPGSDREVKALKERFLRGRGSCSLTGYDIHVVCGTLKDFLRNLSEPLVTYALWNDFVRAVDTADLSEATASLYQAIAQLPQPNRDTLAFIMQHLQKVSESPACKMNKSNLATVFGPTIIGYSSLETININMYLQTQQQTSVVEHLLNLPTEYWFSFITTDLNQERLYPQQGVDSTPNTNSVSKRMNRTRKIFQTPPVQH